MQKHSDVAAFYDRNPKIKLIPLDEIDVAIMKNLLEDASVANSTLSIKFSKTEANIKRRRLRIEDSFLSKNYLLDVSKLGWRIGDIQVDVGGGRSEELAEQIFGMYPNILEISLRVNSAATVSARIFYKDNSELASIIDKIKRLSFVRDVAFSEVIKIVRSRSIGTMREVFVKRKSRRQNQKRKSTRVKNVES